MAVVCTENWPWQRGGVRSRAQETSREAPEEAGMHGSRAGASGTDS